MARSDRLIRLMQHLRTERPPVTAARLADLTGVSVRAIYRDIATLRGSGAVIDGAAGVGYTLTEDGTLPPQTLTRAETEAVILGLSAVQAEDDPELAEAARGALAKLIATLPEGAAAQARHAASRAVRGAPRPAATVDPARIRRAVWDERVVAIRYRDAGERVTERQIWPLSMVYFERVLVVLAWCRLREDYRTFRLDRIDWLEETGLSFRPRRARLLADVLARLSAGAAP